jgi:hypothetical protein
VRLLAGVGNFFFVLFLAANSDDVVAAAAGRAVQLRGDRQQAALKDQRNRAPSTLIAPNPRARARRSRATRSASWAAVRLLGGGAAAGRRRQFLRSSNNRKQGDC